jgi:putative hydrolase of HD superfamily
MKPEQLVTFLHQIEALKYTFRHSWTSFGNRETVAEHSWRLAVMALLLQEEFPELEMGKVIEMCLIHDFGEAVTGDIPSFDKTQSDEQKEWKGLMELLKQLPSKEKSRFLELFQEMEELKSPEAKLVKALDQLEAVCQHNEADLSTWIDLEYTLNAVYGKEAAQAFPYTQKLQEVLSAESEEKIKAGRSRK